MFRLCARLRKLVAAGTGLCAAAACIDSLCALSPPPPHFLLKLSRVRGISVASLLCRVIPIVAQPLLALRRCVGSEALFGRSLRLRLGPRHVY